jgi:hypothetical protein
MLCKLVYMNIFWVKLTSQPLRGLAEWDTHQLTQHGAIIGGPRTCRSRKGRNLLWPFSASQAAMPPWRKKKLSVTAQQLLGGLQSCTWTETS